MIKNWSLFALFLLSLISCSDQNAEQNLKIEPACLSSQSECQILVNNLPVDILFDREKIVPEYEFNIVVKSAFEAVITSAYLEGENMYMGKIPIFFEQDEKENIFQGKGFVGSCNLEEMTWRLTIEFDIGESIITRSVLFNSYRN